MAEVIKAVREAAKIAGATFGLKIGQSTATAGDQRVNPQTHPDVFALPVDDTLYMPLQDLDPDSDTFGMTFFLVDYDYDGDATKVVR